jgi:mannosyltransferase OCH1-like enzyme
MKIKTRDLKYYYLTIGDDKEKINNIESIFKNLNLTQIQPYEINCERKDLAGTNKGPSGSMGHARMVQAGLLDQDRSKPFQPFVILEDDVSLFHELPDTIEYPTDADLVYLGNSLLGTHPTERYEQNITAFQIHDNLYQIYNMLSGHAIMITSALGASAYQNAMIDGFYAGNIWDSHAASMQEHYNVYAFKYPIFYQNKKYGGKEPETNFVFTNGTFVDLKKQDNVQYEYNVPVYSTIQTPNLSREALFNSGANVRISSQRKTIDDYLLNSHTIPKIIHVAWKDKTFLKSQNPIVLNGIKQLIEINPDWKLEISDDNDVERYLQYHLSREDYSIIKNQHIVPKVDVWRLLKIFNEGGIYTDIDRYHNKKLKEIISNNTKCILPLHARNNQIIDFSQDIMISAPGNPIYKYALELNFMRRHNGCDDIMTLGAATYFHAVTKYITGIPMERYPSSDQVEIILDKIKNYKHIETYIEDSTFNTLTYDKNNATVLQGNGLDKDAFYKESDVTHWAKHNHCDVNVK